MRIHTFTKFLWDTVKLQTKMIQNIIVAILIAVCGILYMHIQILQNNNEICDSNIKAIEKRIELYAEDKALLEIYGDKIRAMENRIEDEKRLNEAKVKAMETHIENLTNDYETQSNECESTRFTLDKLTKDLENMRNGMFKIKI